jgi:hypothetical protein
MMNFRKRLCIEVEEPQEQMNEEETLLCSLQKESKSLKLPESHPGQKSHEDDKQKISELNNPYLNQLLQYTEGENPPQDLSYHW